MTRQIRMAKDRTQGRRHDYVDLATDRSVPGEIARGLAEAAELNYQATHERVVSGGLPGPGWSTTGGSVPGWAPPDERRYCQRVDCGALLDRSGNHVATGTPDCPDPFISVRADARRHELLPKKHIAQ